MHPHRAIGGGFSLVSKNNHYLYICAENDKIKGICEQYAVTYDCKKLSYMLYVKIIDCFWEAKQMTKIKNKSYISKHLKVIGVIQDVFPHGG